jgi:hypothetical protein
MEIVPIFMFLLYFGFFAICAVIIVYLIVKRINNRGKEGFEERDN